MSLNNKKFSKGFSLIELIFVIFVISLLGLVVSKFAYDILYYNVFFSRNLAFQENARKALEIMTAEIRTASPSISGGYPLLQTSTSSFIFFKSRGEGFIPRRINYFLDGTTLKKGITEASGNPIIYDPDDEIVVDFIEGVRNEGLAVFSYYDSDYDGTTPPLEEPFDISLVRLVKIDLILEIDPLNPSRNLNLSTQVSIRNLKSTL